LQRSLSIERVLIATAIAAGVLVRLGGLFTDFWLDEIWSLALARQANSVLDIFVRLRHDNNHHLNTLYLYLVGAHANWTIYRLLSFVSGIALVPLLAATGRDRLERMAVATLAAAAAMPVVYSSEARGYAPAAALAVAAWLVSRRVNTPLGAFAFGLVAATSMLGHMSASFVYLGIIAADLLRRRALRLGVAMHALPLLTLGWLVWLSRVMVIGGGLPMGKLDAAIEAIRLTAGWPFQNWTAMGIAIAVIGVIANEIRRRPRDEAAFFLVAVFVAPLVAFASVTLPHAHPRYFFLPGVIALILFASFVARMRVAGAVVIVLWLAGSALQLAPFLRDGRGRYLDAMLWIARQSGGAATVSGDYDFGNATTIAFYQPYLPEELRVRYVIEPAQWHLAHSFDPDVEAPDVIGAYREVARFRHGGFSGWTWIVYRSQK
jgi:hypothetical protein